VELKERLGNPGKAPLPRLTALVTTSGAPRPSGFADGASLVQYVLDHGASAWIGPTDAGASILADLYDDWLIARAAWRETGSDKEFKAYDSLTKTLGSWLSELCLTPGKRSGLGLVVVQAKAAGLAALREERALKAGRPAS
jgi:hypothetical protein